MIELNAHIQRQNKMVCEFKVDGICENDDMHSGEECDFPNEEDCPKTYQFFND